MATKPTKPNKETKSATFKFGQVTDTSTVVIPVYQEPNVRNEDVFVPAGPDNTYPNQLFEVVTQSPSAMAIVTLTTQLIAARYNISLNWMRPNSSERDNTVDNKLTTINDLVYALIQDYMIFGGFAIQLIRNRLGSLSEIVHVPFEMIRLNTTRTKIWFNKNWSKYSTNSIDYCSFDGFVPKENGEEDTSQIYVFVNSGQRYTYPISPFRPCIYDIAAEALSSQYIKSSIDSGLSCRYIIDLPNSANLTDEQKADIEKGIKDKFTGLANAGTFMLFFNSSADELKVSTIDEDNSHEKFNAIREAAKQNIFRSLHCTPALSGDPSQTTGFSEQEYEQAFQLYNTITIHPVIDQIQRTFDLIFGLNNFSINLKEQYNQINKDNTTATNEQ